MAALTRIVILRSMRGDDRSSLGRILARFFGKATLDFEEFQDLSHDRAFIQHFLYRRRFLLTEVAAVLAGFVLPLVPGLLVLLDFARFAFATAGFVGDRAVGLAFAAPSERVEWWRGRFGAIP